MKLATVQMLNYYRHVDGDYDSWADGLHDRMARRLATVADPRDGEHVLDIGCGTGLVARHLSPGVGPYGRLVGVDLSDNMLYLAKRRSTGRASFLKMAAEDLTLPDCSFDLVTMGQSLPYFENPEGGLAEAFRVLKPGGRIAVSCQRRSLSTPAQTVFFSCLGRLAWRHPLRVPRPSEDRAVFGEPRVLINLLREAGFREVERTETVIGASVRNAHAWTDLMTGAGPYPHALLAGLGERARLEFEAEVEWSLAELEHEGTRIHHAFSCAVARRP
ncbi:MAG: class I SAM-dependent methyltransferase [Candidatus Dormibacteria bacterium]